MKPGPPEAIFKDVKRIKRERLKTTLSIRNNIPALMAYYNIEAGVAITDPVQSDLGDHPDGAQVASETCARFP